MRIDIYICEGFLTIVVIDTKGGILTFGGCDTWMECISRMGGTIQFARHIEVHTTTEVKS